MADALPAIGLIIVGDEILSGKRADKHLPKTIELLRARGLLLDWARYVGDDRARITGVLRDAFASGDRVFCCGGIGATPDDHTRQCAAAALGVPLALHPAAARLITERAQDVAQESGVVFDAAHPDMAQRLKMGFFPEGAVIVPNPYNKIPGFACDGSGGGRISFVPGFPVMAWPMIEAELDRWLADRPAQRLAVERSVVVWKALEASLTPLMEAIEREHPAVRVFSLPSVDHPEHGRHIELGVKGPDAESRLAFAALREALSRQGAAIGPEMVR